MFMIGIVTSISHKNTDRLKSSTDDPETIKKTRTSKHSFTAPEKCGLKKIKEKDVGQLKPLQRLNVKA